MPSKPKIPEYLTLLKTIKQLCSHESVNADDKNQLLDWAYQTKLLQLQLNGKAISKTLVDSLNQLLTPLTEVIVRLNNQGNNDKLLNELHQHIDDFYQPLHQLTDTFEPQVLQERWQKAVAEDPCISLSTTPTPNDDNTEATGFDDLDIIWMFESDQSPFI